MFKKSVIMLSAVLLVGQIVAGPLSAAENLPEKITRMIQLSQKEYKGNCSKQILQTGVRDQELFSIMKCPVTFPEQPVLIETASSGNTSKGSLIYPFTCKIIITDYYAGKKKKSLEKIRTGKVSADYLYALDELSFKNIEVEGSRACAQPVLKKLEELMK